MCHLCQNKRKIIPTYWQKNTSMEGESLIISINPAIQRGRLSPDAHFPGSDRPISNNKSAPTSVNLQTETLNGFLQTKYCKSSKFYNLPPVLSRSPYLHLKILCKEDADFTENTCMCYNAQP